MKTENMNFGEALEHLKQGDSGEYQVTKKGWYGSQAKPLVKIQKPDKYSKMTEPYLYMEKTGANGKKIMFPLDLSCESILSEDWMIVI